ncbi:MAG: baseplate J/gp47 family protein [Leptospirales bacterium]|nr:baseplate J/gp47 family protein [Leptospirales bacterium]
MDYGVTAQGFIRKSYDKILSDLQALARSSEYFGESIDLSDESPIGAEIKLMAWSLSNQWQLAEDVYYSFDIDAAEGAALNRLTRLGLVARKDEIRSNGYLLFTGDPYSPISIGTQAETEQGVIFMTTIFAETNNEGDAMIAAECIEAGAKGNVTAESITKIKTPVAGIMSVINPLPFEGGRGIESDYELKSRYESSHLASGSALDAIVAKVLNIPAVLEAIGYENVESYTDSNGLMAGSIEIIAFGGDDDMIAKTIFTQKPAGVNTFGNVTKTVFDSKEKDHIIRFSRPTVVEVYIEYVLSVNANYDYLYEDNIKQAAVDFVNIMSIASALYSWKLCSLLRNVSGLEDVKAYIGLTSSVVNLDKLVPSPRQLYRTSINKVVVSYE